MLMSAVIYTPQFPNAIAMLQYVVSQVQYIILPPIEYNRLDIHLHRTRIINLFPVAGMPPSNSSAPGSRVMIPSK